MWNPRWSNFVHMGAWVSLFAAMMVTGFLKKGVEFPGGNSEFWRQACEDHRWNACKTWVRILNDDCQDGSGAACFTLGTVLNEGRIVPRNAKVAGVTFGRSCDLGIRSACTRLVEFAHGDGKDVFQRACDDGDGASCFILGSLYSSGSGVPQDGARAFNLFQKSCSDRWWRGCGRLGTSYLVGQGTAPDPEKAVENFEKGCQGRNAASCLEVAKLYHGGIGALRDDVLARERLEQSCDLGLQIACRQLETPVLSRSSMAGP
jgi:TPR repeat protein